MANELKRVGLVFTQEGAVDFKKTLQDINIEMNKNYNQFKLTQAQWDKSTKSTEKLRAEQEYLKNAYEIQADRVSTLRMQLSDLENAENKNTTAIKKKQNELTAAEIKLEAYNKKLKEIGSQLGNTGQKIEEFGTKLENTGKSIEGAGKKLSAFSAASASALIASAKSAIDFEDAFAGVEKTVDGTAEQMEDLKKGIRDMAKQIPSTTTEISAVAEAAGQLGIKTEDILSFTKVMIDLGNSTNLSANEAASALAKFANVTKMSADDYDKLGSTIVALGNNFATTEADIVSMSTKLAATGELAGLSQPQILSLATAMSSVGIEAEAGGSAMSKLLKKIQLATELGGEDLKKFASVAGMTSDEFKQAFEKDAVKALTAFISGLNDTERNGKSAIGVLDDMGLTEVRLSNTILSLANASDVMTKAVNLGSEAWEDNTALTKEANKRYDTLKSKITTAINKLKDIAITVGNKLMPTIEKIIEGFGKWADSFDKLSEEQVDMIVKLGLIVAAIGPVVTILGKLVSTVGGVTKTIGTVTQAVGVMNKTITSSSASVNGLASVFKAVTSPIGLATAGIAAAVAVMAIVKAQVDEETKAVSNFITELDRSVGARKSSLDAIYEQQNANLAEIDNVTILRKELEQLTDENGRVKEGYENRANFILNELNKSLGTEYSMTGNVINQYGELINTLDEVILKKKASLILESQEAAYKEAINNKTKAYEDYLDTQKNLADVKKQLKDEEVSYAEALANGSVVTYKHIEKIKKLQEQEETLTNSLGTQQQELGKYQNAIEQYEKNSERFLEGSNESLKEIEKSVAQTQRNITTSVNDELSKRIKNQIEANERTKELYDMEVQYNKNAKESIFAENVKDGERELQLLADQLVAQTSTIGELGLDEISAWKTLANNSYDEYNNAISKLPGTTQQEIQRVTGVITADTTMTNASEDKANLMNSMFGNKLSLSGITQEEVNSSARKLNQDTSVQNEAGNLADRAEAAVNSNDSSVWGEDMVEGLGIGIRNKGASYWFKSILNGVAGTIASYLHFSRPDVGPLREYEKWMPDMVEGLGKSLDKSSPKLINSVKNMTNEMSEELKNVETGTTNNISSNTSSNGSSVKVDVDYNKMAQAITGALTNCKFTLDEDGFAKIVKDELYKVV